MKLATIRSTHSETFAALLREDELVELPGFADVGAFLRAPAAEQDRAIKAATSDNGSLQTVSAQNADFAPLLVAPSKTICVGLNYADHIKETGNETPKFPTLFAKFADTLAGAHDDIQIPEEDHRIDWEAELVIVIGSGGRRIPGDQAAQAIAGYTIANDISMRGYQGRTMEWLQGKIWDATTPVGPYMLSADEFDPAARIYTTVNGETVQDDTLDTQVFSPAELVAYISTITTLRAGDLILTGTPAGVALGRRNEEGRHPWLKAGDEITAGIEGIGEQRNKLV
ncbi:fumarylacetoacetate hydrolase family protein [Micrococcoides hystricis]|uniref:Fumarylacetoacetate hydrolase family protein n=1 Tax=Micrococcoides hystricis TaxID=1572761 RepID=A0ABV6PBP0_9MICC